MTTGIQRAAAAATMLLFTTLHASGARAQPSALTLDGVRDGGYLLLAQDSAGDLAPFFDTALPYDTQWADLTNLYVATDTTSLWLYADLPEYSANSYGEFGLAIDTDSLANSGGVTGPVVNGITFTYTSTRNNVNASPLLTTSILLPDVVIQGRLFSPANDPPVGWTELNHWTGSAWDGLGVNWGGVTNTLVGTHVGFSYGNGIELNIPFSDLGVAPAATLNLEFYALGHKPFGQPTGAIDTIPGDAQAQADHDPTVLRRLATINPPPALTLLSFSAGAYAVAEAAGSAPITLTAAPTSTQPISFNFAAAGGSAGPGDFVAVSQVFTIAAGAPNRVISLHVLTDTLAEPDETVLLTLSQPVNAQLAQPYAATLTIHDTPPVNTLWQLFLPLTRR